MNNELTRDYIRTIAEKKSISRAADQLGISQPALSAYLRKVEKHLGVELFDRSVLPIELTRAGQEYLKYLDGVENLYEEFRQSLKQADRSI